MSEIKVNSIKGVGASSAAISVDNSSGSATANLTTVNSVTMPNGGFLSNRNIIINGAMQVAQRGTSSTTNGYGSVDRYAVYSQGTDEAPTHAQVDVASGTTPYTLGFRKAIKVTNGNQTSGAGAGDLVAIDYTIEAQDIANSGWNYLSTSSYVTLSFWIKSSVAQNFYVMIRSEDTTKYNYPIETGSLTADTWTKITKTIPGNSNLTFNNDNGAGLLLEFVAFRGTNGTGSVTLNQWAAYDSSARVPNMTSTWYTTNDATFEITGVQLEVGSVATDFEHRLFADELRSCRRYFWSPINAGWTGDEGAYLVEGIYYGSSKMTTHWYHPEEMRTSPTVSFATGSSYYSIYRADGGDSFSSLGNVLNPNSLSATRFTLMEIQSNVSGSGGDSGVVGALNSNVYVHFSAEL